MQAAQAVQAVQTGPRPRLNGLNGLDRLGPVWIAWARSGPPGRLGPGLDRPSGLHVLASLVNENQTGPDRL